MPQQGDVAGPRPVRAKSPDEYDIIVIITIVLGIIALSTKLYNLPEICVPEDVLTGPHGLSVPNGTCAFRYYRYVPVVVVDNKGTTLINETIDIGLLPFPRLFAHTIAWSSDGKALASCIFQSTRWLLVTTYTRPSIDTPNMTSIHINLVDYRNGIDPARISVFFTNQDADTHLNVVTDEGKVLLRQYVSRDMKVRVTQRIRKMASDMQLALSKVSDYDRTLRYQINAVRSADTEECVMLAELLLADPSPDECNRSFMGAEDRAIVEKFVDSLDDDVARLFARHINSPENNGVSDKLSHACESVSVAISLGRRALQINCPD